MLDIINIYIIFYINYIFKRLNHFKYFTLISKEKKLTKFHIEENKEQVVTKW